jgi:hypothetical protein
MNTPDREAKLTREATAKALTEAGFPISKATLATKASRGGGPVYQLFGRKPLYCWGDALDWAKGRLSKPMRTTSELKAAGNHAAKTSKPPSIRCGSLRTGEAGPWRMPARRPRHEPGGEGQ